MKHSSKRSGFIITMAIIIIAVAVTLMILSILEKTEIIIEKNGKETPYIGFPNTNIFGNLSIYFTLLSVLAAQIYFKVQDLRSNKREIDSLGAYNTFDAIDRYKVFAYVKTKLCTESNTVKNKVIYINYENLDHAEVANIKMRLYQELTKHKRQLSLGNINVVDKLDYEDFNKRIFYNKKKKKNIYIFDEENTSCYDVESLERKYLLLNNDKYIMHTYIIYLTKTKHVLEDEFNILKESKNHDKFCDNIFGYVERKLLFNYKKNSFVKEVIFINYEGLNYDDIKKIRGDFERKLEEEKRKLSVGRIQIIDKYDYEDFSNRISDSHKSKKNIYIFDEDSTDYSKIESIEEKFHAIDKNAKKSQRNKMYQTHIIYFVKTRKITEHLLCISMVDIDNLLDRAGYENVELCKTSLINEEKIIIKNVLALDDIISKKNTLQHYETKILLKYNPKMIFISYLLKTGSYERAYRILLDNFEKKVTSIKDSKDAVYYYVLADCLHLMGEYSLSLDILNNIFTTLSKEHERFYELLMFIQKLLMHVEKHLGHFSNSISQFNKIKQTILHNTHEINVEFYKRMKRAALSVYMIDNISNNLKATPKYSEQNADDIKDYLNENRGDAKADMYYAAYIAIDEPKNALKIIDNCINYFIKTCDRYLYNAYYIKAEILRISHNYNDAYSYYVKSSGYLDNHVDINLLDQNYFSVKLLEKLGLVKNDFSMRIKQFKDKNYDDNNHNKIAAEIINKYDSKNANTEIKLLFNDQLSSLMADNVTISDVLLEKIMNTVFIIL